MEKVIFAVFLFCMTNVIRFDVGRIIRTRIMIKQYGDELIPLMGRAAFLRATACRRYIRGSSMSLYFTSSLSMFLFGISTLVATYSSTVVISIVTIAGWVVYLLLLLVYKVSRKQLRDTVFQNIVI